MPKGYWIARIDVNDVEEYQKYVDGGSSAYAKYGGVALARGGRSHVLEGEGRTRNVIWEFPSFEAAIACFESPEYQSARVHRERASVGEFIVVEGVE